MWSTQKNIQVKQAILRAKLNQLHSCLDITRQKIDHVKENLLNIRDCIDAMGQNLEGDDFVEKKREALCDMEHRYTMESERAIHRQVLNGQASDTSAPKGAPSSGPTANGTLF